MGTMPQKLAYRFWKVLNNPSTPSQQVNMYEVYNAWDGKTFCCISFDAASDQNQEQIREVITQLNNR